MEPSSGFVGAKLCMLRCNAARSHAGSDHFDCLRHALASFTRDFEHAHAGADALNSVLKMVGYFSGLSSPSVAESKTNLICSPRS